MSIFGKILIGVGCLMFLVVVSFGCTLMSFNNDCVVLENEITTQHQNNQVVYDTMWKSVQETAGVAEAHADKVKEIAIATIEGRYQNDSQVLFKAIAEANQAPLPPDLYKKVQQIIEAKRNEFQANQTTLLAKKQVYDNKRQQIPGSIYASFLGFPRIDLSQYGVVTSGKTKETFKTGEENASMKPFGDNG